MMKAGKLSTLQGIKIYITNGKVELTTSIREKMLSITIAPQYLKCFKTYMHLPYMRWSLLYGNLTIKRKKIIDILYSQWERDALVIYIVNGKYNKIKIPYRERRV